MNLSRPRLAFLHSFGASDVDAQDCRHGIADAPDRGRCAGHLGHFHMRFRAGHAGPRAGLRSGDVARRRATPQWSPRTTDLESRPTPSTNEAAVVDVQVLDQAAVDRVNASRVLG